MKCEETVRNGPEKKYTVCKSCGSVDYELNEGDRCRAEVPCLYWQQEGWNAADRKFDGGEFSAALQSNSHEPCGSCPACLEDRREP